MLFVPAEGPVVLQGAAGRSHETVDQYLPSPQLSAFDGGLDLSERARQFAGTVKDYLRAIGTTGRSPPSLREPAPEA